MTQSQTNSPSLSHPRRPLARGLSADQWEDARRVAERLQGEFGTLLRSFPMEHRTIAGMSAWLGVTRPVCQRLLRGVRHRDDPINALTFFPGVRGLHQVAAAAADRGCSEVLVAAADAAIDRYAALIDEHGGSQARLRRALQDRAPEGSDGAGPHLVSEADAPLDEDEARRMGFLAARAITGREFETHLAAFVYRPDPEDPGLMDCVTAMGMLGIRHRAGALPICPMQTHSHDDSEEEGDTTFHVGLPSFVHALESFCTTPMPKIVQHEVSTGRPVLIDPDQACHDPIDLVLLSESLGAPNPAGHEPTLEECSLVSDGPARNIIITAYLHRSLARASIATAGVFAQGNRGPIGPPAVGPDGTIHSNQSAHRWFDRLPRRPRLEQIGIGLEQASHAAYPRLAELIESMFDRKGWDPDEFVGFRCHDPYPFWGSQYVVTFDFGGVEDDTRANGGR